MAYCISTLLNVKTEICILKLADEPLLNLIQDLIIEYKTDLNVLVLAH